MCQGEMRRGDQALSPSRAEEAGGRSRGEEGGKRGSVSTWSPTAHGGDGKGGP